MKPMLESLASIVGLRGGWFYYRGTWDKKSKKYVYEHSADGIKWLKGDHAGNTISIQYVGGPKDGKVEM